MKLIVCFDKLYQNSIWNLCKTPIFESLIRVRQNNLHALSAHWPHLWSRWLTSGFVWFTVFSVGPRRSGRGFTQVTAPRVDGRETPTHEQDCPAHGRGNRRVPFSTAFISVFHPRAERLARAVALRPVDSGGSDRAASIRHCPDGRAQAVALNLYDYHAKTTTHLCAVLVLRGAVGSGAKPLADGHRYVGGRADAGR